MQKKADGEKKRRKQGEWREVQPADCWYSISNSIVYIHNSLFQKSSNSSLLKNPSNLLSPLALGQQQPQQNARLLRVQEPTGNLGLLVVTRDTRSGHLAVDSAMALDNGDVVFSDNVVDCRVEGSRDASCAGTGNLFLLALLPCTITLE